MEFTQYEVVQVSKLLKAPDAYEGWSRNRRPPQIGDIGTIVEVLKAEGIRDCYVVESVDQDGFTIWLCDFDKSELAVPDPEIYSRWVGLS